VPSFVGSEEAGAGAATQTTGAVNATGPRAGKLNLQPAPRISPNKPPPASPAERVVDPALPEVDPAIVSLVPDPYPEAARDLKSFRAEINVPTRNTVGVVRTDVPGLEKRVFRGASKLVRREGRLPPAVKVEIEAPFEMLSL
jgi:hypothetical protein